MTDKPTKAAAPAKDTGTAGTDLPTADDDIVGVTSVDQLPRSQVDGSVADNKGIVSNRPEGTIQSEPTAEELPSDCRVSPVAEQLLPNSKMAVGHLTISGGGLQLPEGVGDDEIDRNLKPDMSRPELPEGSKQGDKLDRVVELAKVNAEEARAE